MDLANGSIISKLNTPRQRHLRPAHDRWSPQTNLCVLEQLLDVGNSLGPDSPKGSGDV